MKNKASETATTIMAVSIEDFQKFGCPYCGYRSGNSSISFAGASDFRCGECQKTSVVLAQGVEKSPIDFGGESPYHPTLQKHPREGIPSHGNPDIRPKDGGEFFRSRGIGADTTPGCFACTEKHEGIRRNIAGFVHTKEAGERVVEMFGLNGARLDYRSYQPDRIQVKIGACNQHVHNLEILHKLLEDGIITSEKIAEAKKRKK